MNVDTLAVMYDSAKDDDTHKTSFTGSGDVYKRQVGGVRDVKLFKILDKKHEEFVLNQNNIIEKQKQMNMLGQWNTIIDLSLIHI